jgi:hypothetical protein
VEYIFCEEDTPLEIYCLPYYAYVFSSTKLGIRAEQVLPGSEGGKGQWEK